MLKDIEPLVIDSQKGDLNAFEEIISRYSRWLLGLCASIIGAEEAEDFSQDIWLKAWTNIHTLKDPAKFKSWLRVVATNLILGKISKTKLDIVELDLECDPPVEPVNIDKLLEDQELIYSIMLKLTDIQKLIFVYTEIEGMTNKEIAEIIGVPEGTIKSRLHGIRKKISLLIS